ncbi:MAG TPA: glycosyltransferase family 87 protein [Hanamia sp.]
MLNKRYQSLYQSIFWTVMGITFAILTYLLSKIGFKESISKTILFFSSCILVHYSVIKQKKYEIPVSFAVLGILLFLIGDFFYDLAQSYLHIPLWDFMCFYLFGNVGISGLNFYDPHAFMQVFNNLNLHSIVGDGLTHEVVNVGFWYPPPSMFLFLPLGIFSLKTGYIIWQTVIILFLLLDILLIIKWFPYNLNSAYNKKTTGFLLAILILLFPSITGSILISQTPSIFLFFLILILKYSDNWKSGIYLVLLIIIKPLAIFFLLYFLFYKNWKVLISCLITGCLIIGVSSLCFGFNSFIIFLKSPPTNRIPFEIFYESTEQSLFAVLLRLQHRFYGSINFQNIKILTYILSVPFILISFYSSKLLSKKNPLLAFMIFIILALLLYPNTLVSYIIILIPIMIYLLNQNPFKNNFVNWIILFFLYTVGHYSFFLLNIVLWLGFIIWSLPYKYNLIERQWIRHAAGSIIEK